MQMTAQAGASTKRVYANDGSWPSVEALGRKIATHFFVTEVQAHGLCLTHDDLMQEVGIAYCRAKAAFDPGRNARFITYFHWAARNRMLEVITRAKFERNRLGLYSISTVTDPDGETIDGYELVHDENAQEPGERMERMQEVRERLDALSPLTRRFMRALIAGECQRNGQAQTAVTFKLISETLGLGPKEQKLIAAEIRAKFGITNMRFR